jgi:iron complex outermembrane receptor protein
MGNIDSENSELPSYFVNDLNISYEIQPKSVFKSVMFSLLVNNLLNVKYYSNGADYGGGYVYYFPQAGINFLAGISMKF